MNRLNSLLPRSFTVTRIIINKDNMMGRHPKCFQYIIEQAGVSFALADMIAVKDNIEPSEEIVLLI
jgi:hypothetical protein